MYSARKKYELSDLLSFPPADLPSICRINRFAKEYCENDNIWKEQLFSDENAKSFQYQIETDAKKLGYNYFELYTSDEAWKDMFLLRVSDPSVDIFDPVVLELMEAYQLTWKQLYLNRGENNMIYWNDVINAYIEWLSEISKDRYYGHNHQLTLILSHIGYLDPQLFIDLFTEYLGIVGNRVATYRTIIMYTLDEYGRENRHSEFQPLLEFLMNEFFSLSDKEVNRPVELTILLPSISYHDCYYAPFVDYIIERFDPYLTDYDSWDTLLLLILDTVVQNIYVSETHEPVLFMNKIMFGTKYSFKDELEIISKFGGKQSYKGIPYLEDIFGTMSKFRKHQLYLDSKSNAY